MSETPYDPKKMAADAIEATTAVLRSIKRQRERMESDMERMQQAHDDLMKIEGWVKIELSQQIRFKQELERAEKEAAGG